MIFQRKATNAELIATGYSTSNPCKVYQESGFMTGKWFNYWYDYLFRPELHAKRRIYCYNGPALVIFDGFGPHNSDRFHDPVDNVILHFMPPHTSDQVQPLDLGVFAIQKRFMSSYAPHKKYSDQTRQLIKVLVSVQRACVPPVIIAAFRRAGIIHNQTPAGTFGMVEKRFMTAVRHFNLPAEDDDLDQFIIDRTRVPIPQP